MLVKFNPTRLLRIGVLIAILLFAQTAARAQHAAARLQDAPARSSPPAQAAPGPQKIILDTDIGDDIDDAYALALLARLPNVQLVGVTTTWGETAERAELTAKLLHIMGKNRVPAAIGRRGGAKIRRQYDWARGGSQTSAPGTGQSAPVNGGAQNASALDVPAQVRAGLSHWPAIQRVDAVTFLKRELDKSPGQITLVGIGPLVNIGDLLTRYPDVKSKIKQIVIMGGSVHVGYNNRPPVDAEWNIKCDPQAARVVFASGVPLTMAGLEVTTMLKFGPERQRRLFAYGTPTTDALAALTAVWGEGTPTLYDVMAVAWACGYHYCDTEQRHVVVEDTGVTRITDGTPNVTVLINPQPDAFLDWYTEVLGGGR